MLGANALQRLRGIDVVHAHSPFVTGWLALRYARRHRLPLVFTYHTRIDEYAHYAPFAHAAFRRVMVKLTRAFAGAADAVIVPTQAMETRLRELGVRSRIAIVPSAIDVERYGAGRRSAAVRLLGAMDERVPLAVAVARLGREKRLELALDALVHIPQVRLAIVGAGPHGPALAAHMPRRPGSPAGSVYRLAPELLPDVYASSDALSFRGTTDAGARAGRALDQAPDRGDRRPGHPRRAGRARPPGPARSGGARSGPGGALAGGRDPAGRPALAAFGRAAAPQNQWRGSMQKCRTFGTQEVRIGDKKTKIRIDIEHLFDLEWITGVLS